MSSTTHFGIRLRSLAAIAVAGLLAAAIPAGAATTISITGVSCPSATISLGTTTDTVACATASAAPGAPIVTGITKGDGTIEVAFTQASTGGTPSSYTLQCIYNAFHHAKVGAASPLALGGLTDSATLTDYACTLTATNSVGSSASTNVNLAGTVAAPTLTLVAGSNSATATLTAADGGSAVVDYTVTCTDGTNTFFVDSSSSQFIIPGLTNDTSYICTATATNSAGVTSSAGSGVPVIPVPGTPPGAPTIGTPTAGSGSISVAFTAPSSTGTVSTGGAATITSYTATCGSQTGTGTSSPITVSGLTNGTAYTCTVRATNSANLTGPASAASASTTPAAGTPPTAPTIGTPTAGSGSISVAFTAPSSAGTTPTGAATISSYTATCGSYTGTGTSSPITVSGLTNGTAYTCTVTATNSYGLTGPASAASASTTPVAGPVCSPPSGWTCDYQPYSMNKFGTPAVAYQYDVNTARQYWFSAAAGKIQVHPVVFNSSYYTSASAYVQANQYTNNTNNRDIVISSTPGSMTPVGTSCSSLNKPMQSTIYISFAGAAGYCSLTKGQTYYVNVKANSASLPVDYLLYEASM